MRSESGNPTPSNEEKVTSDIPPSKIPCIVSLASRTSADRTIVVGSDRGRRDAGVARGLLPASEVCAS